jgi:steroid delta-isomerase-like uncharacterized protein
MTASGRRSGPGGRLHRTPWRFSAAGCPSGICPFVTKAAPAHKAAHDERSRHDRQADSNPDEERAARVVRQRRDDHALRAGVPGRQATIDELCDPGFVDHNPAPDHEPTLAGFKEKVEYTCARFPDLTEDLQDVIASGDTVATRWVLTGSQQQEFMGIPASGQSIRVEGMNFYRLRDGRVSDIWTQFDGVGMMQQLGAIPA